MFLNFREFFDQNNSLDHEILSLYVHGENIRKIQELTNVSIGRIYRTINKFGIKPKRRDKSDFYSLIRNYHSSGTNVDRISNLTGYSKKHIKNIINKDLNY